MLSRVFFIAFGVCFAFSACTSSSKPLPSERNIAQQRYFDIPLFFEQQAESLGTRKVQKTMQYQEESESKEFTYSTKAHWEREFALFAQVQLNTPSLADAYQIDTLYDTQDTLHYAVRYTAKQPEKLYVQSVDLFFKKPQLLQSLGLVLYNDNFLAPSNYFLQYEVNKGYSIHLTKQMPFDTISQIHLSAVFLPS